ncbi:MAG: c-type cytochrome [Saccharospirillaceae bacterium]|nr:c-type cytochrome [Saccharospirillaceae bacterium]MCD8530826.1 c-type cytochrome [Saccharospirillaceae bacterium]
MIPITRPVAFAAGFMAFAALSAMLSAPARADALQQQAQAVFGSGEAPKLHYSEAEAELGRILFFDARIGRDGTHCGTCHEHSKGGADGRKTAQGAFGLQGKRNTPTIVDIVPQISMHWTGDRESLADQAIRSLTAPPAYAHASIGDALAVIQALPDLNKRFNALYDDGVTAANWGKALSAYQEYLVTTSAFDRYLQGDAEALNAAQKEGLKTFINTGCAGCHNGRLLGGTSYQTFGIVADYTQYTGSQEDIGRMAFTGKESDRRVFKVPPLRHAAQTAPYFHDGSVAELNDAIDIMAKVQLGRTLSAEDNQAIQAFLQAVTAPMPTALQRP